MNTGKSIRLFLEDGTPGGLISAEIGNWTGRVVTAPRSDLAKLLKRPEAQGPGIYILLGEDPEKLGGEIAYVGEAENISKRLPQHSRNEDSGGKDFWNKAIVLTSKDNNLTKAHVRYLESRIIELAKQAERSALENSTAPPLPSLPEADVSDMEYFLMQLKIILPILNVNLLRSRTRSDKNQKESFTTSNALSPILELEIKKDKITAQAQEIDGEFTVFKGSHARRQWKGVGTNYIYLRERLEADGSIRIPQDGAAVFERDVVFASPSAAAAVITGRNANGRKSWKDPLTNLTFGEWQDKGLDSEE